MPKTCGEWIVLFVIVAVMLGGTALCMFAAYGASVRFDLPWL
jgi:hypothetical protein